MHRSDRPDCSVPGTPSGKHVPEAVMRFGFPRQLYLQVKPALLGLSITQSFRKLQSDVLEIQWTVENWVATQLSEASVASARARVVSSC